MTMATPLILACEGLLSSKCMINFRRTIWVMIMTIGQTLKRFPRATYQQLLHTQGSEGFLPLWFSAMVGRSGIACSGFIGLF